MHSLDLTASDRAALLQLADPTMVRPVQAVYWHPMTGLLISNASPGHRTDVMHKPTAEDCTIRPMVSWVLDRVSAKAFRPVTRTLGAMREGNIQRC